jgi:hypothetical protein
MPQQWNRTYPLHWFEAFLSWAITPFTRAKKIEVYATNGYYLMGIVLLIIILFLWVSGFLVVILSLLPTPLLDVLESMLGPSGRKFLSLQLIVLLVPPYLILFFIKRLRVWIGEAFARLFFGTVHVGIMAGEWCLESRWWSLFIVICLAGFIAWGTFYFFDTRNRNGQLVGKFNRWLGQVNYFCTNSSLKWDRSQKYQKEVIPFWDTEFSNIINMPDNNPAFALHQMLEALYSEKSSPNLDQLQSLVDRYKPHEIQKMTPEAQHSWAWMNILVGRMYARECDKKNELYCKKANDSFSNAIALNQSSNNEDYQFAARNGRGTVYATAIGLLSQNPNTIVKDICPDAITCANKALEDYMAIEDSPCSFLAVRSENNKVDLLIRVGFYYDKLEKDQGIDLTKICDGKSVTNEAELATCIESRVKKVMSCSTSDEFFPFVHITVAQAYAVIVRLAADSKADVDQKARVAGNYLRLAYILNTKKTINDEDFSYFRVFQINDGLHCRSDNDNEPWNGKNGKGGQRGNQKQPYQCIFWNALTTDFDIPFDRKDVDNKINDDLKKHNLK